jgi:hypothetical protein
MGGAAAKEPARSTVKDRALALMADGEPRTIRRIAFELGVSYTSVAKLMRQRVLVKIGEARKETKLQPQGQAIVVHPKFARDCDLLFPPRARDRER